MCGDGSDSQPRNLGASGMLGVRDDDAKYSDDV